MTPTILRQWLDLSLDCDHCGSPDGMMRTSYRCPVGCDQATHTASTCLACGHLVLSTSHEQPTGLRTVLRQTALAAVAEARP